MIVFTHCNIGCNGLKKVKKFARALFSRHRLAEGGTLASGQDTSTAA